MKKFLSIVLSILMVVTMLPMAVLPASAAENLDYNIKLEVVDWAVYETSGKLIGEFNAVEHGDAFYDVSLTQADDGTFTCSYQIALERNDGNTAWNESSISFKIDSCEDEFMQEFEKSFYSSYNIFYNLKVTRSAGDSHTFKDATCVAPKTCAICGVTEGDIDATAHSWANLDGICANGCGLECTHENQTGSVCEICGEHICSYNNGFCTECDAYEPATLVTNENYESFYLKADYVGYYAISNGGQLFWYANYINTVDRTANAVLTADIDLENRPWTPIGSTGENSNNFRGIFDGQNYTIRGLYVEGSRAGLGFFGEVRTGTVKNFTIFGEVVVNTEVDYVGGVIGSICGVNGENDLERNGAIIQNITSYVNLTAKAHGVGKIGGFVGYANHQSLIENCSWYGTFDAGEYRVDNGAGGFIGRIQENSSEVTIRNCAAYGTIKTNYAGDYNDTATIYMGGFLSFSNTNAKTTVENCLFAGKFERGENLTDQAFLGAFGTLRSVKAIKNCYYLGDDGLEAVHSDSNLKPGSDNVEITKATEEQLKSGEIAYKLQEANEIWGQSIGTDAYPSFTGGTVYQVENCKGELGYSNTNENIGHQWVNGTCTVCDLVCGHSGGTTKPTDNGNGTHSSTCAVCGNITEEHAFDENGTCICGAEIAFTGIVVDDENSDEYRYDETRKTYTIIIPADEVGGIGYLSYDIIGTNLTLIEDTNTLLKVQHENEDGLTSAPDDLLVDVLQDNGYFGWSVLGYGDGEWEKLLYSNDGGMTWTTYTFEVKQAYSITVNASQNGTVTANEYAIEGDNIALNVSPAEGYMLDTLSVTDASGNSVDVENNAFTMPASAVTVTATFAVCDHKDGRHETATDNGDGTHDATYSCCGATVTEVPHTLDITTGKCSACGADMTVIATVTDSTNTYYAADAATLNQAVTAILETGSRTFTVELPVDAEAEMITAIRRAICDTEGVADGSINLTLGGVTSIPGTTNWDGVAFGPGDIYDEAGEIVDQELVTQLASVNLPDATEIGAQAFYFCENLVAVSAPKAQTIGAQAFGYTALTSVEFPELTTIPTDMFSGTWTLSSAKFPKVTTIEQGGLLIGAKFNPENNPTPFPLELTAEGDIAFNGSYHFNIASRNYSGKVDLVLNIDKKDQVTFNDDGTATWQVRDDLSYTFKSITFTCTDGTTNHSYTYTDNGDGTHDKVCTGCGHVEVDNEAHTIENHVCTACGAMEIVVSFNAGDYEWKTGDQINFVREVEGIGIDYCVFTATVAEDGTVTWTADKPFCWYGEGEQKLFAAPNNGWSIDYFVIPEDQSTSAKLEEADLVNGMWVGTPTTDTVTFNMMHRMAKVTVNYEFAEGVTADISELKVYSIAQICTFSMDDWSIKLTSAGQYDVWVTPYLDGNQFTAFIIPETYATDEDFIKITLSDGTVYDVKMNKAVTFEEGAEYPYKVIITADGAYLTCADECSFEYIANEDGLTHSKVCTECGYVAASEAHSGGIATCTEQAECQHCGASYGEVNAHDWSNLDGVCANGCGAECPHDSYTDGVCDSCKYECTHEWDEGVLTRPTFETAGYYTYTCTLCGHSYTEPTKKADDTALNDASMKVMECIGNSTLTQEALNEIHNSYLDILKNNGNIFDEFGFVRGDLVEEDQPAINAVTAELEKIVADAEEKIASGEYVKADYTEIDEAIASVDEALKNATISDEMSAELEDIKADLEDLKENEGATMADVNELLERAETVAEKINNCAKGVHSFTKYEEVTAPECGKAGLEKAVCDHGCGATDEKEIPALTHEPLAAVVENEVAAECEKAGSYDLVVYCDLCGDELDRDTITVDALTHKDDDGDYLCDHGCGHEFPKPVEPEQPDTPDTPDEPTDEACDHLCHKDGILGFLWKIIRFFYRLFNIQQYCDCGILHYDTPLFG